MPLAAVKVIDEQVLLAAMTLLKLLRGTVQNPDDVKLVATDNVIQVFKEGDATFALEAIKLRDSKSRWTVYVQTKYARYVHTPGLRLYKEL